MIILEPAKHLSLSIFDARKTLLNFLEQSFNFYFLCLRESGFWFWDGKSFYNRLTLDPHPNYFSDRWSHLPLPQATCFKFLQPNEHLLLGHCLECLVSLSLGSHLKIGKQVLAGSCLQSCLIKSELRKPGKLRHLQIPVSRIWAQERGMCGPRKVGRDNISHTMSQVMICFV